MSEKDGVMFDKFRKILKITHIIKKSEVAKSLGLSEDALFEKLIDWGEKIPFKIEDDKIIVDQPRSTVITDTAVKTEQIKPEVTKSEQNPSIPVQKPLLIPITPEMQKLVEDINKNPFIVQEMLWNPKKGGQILVKLKDDLSKFEESVFLLITKGFIALYLNQLNEAQDYFNQALKLDINQLQVYLGLVSVGIKTKHLIEVWPQLQVAQMKDPENIFVLDKLGEFQYAQEKFEDAEATFKKIIEKDPTFANAWYNLGTMYYEQKKNQDAETYLRKATELSPNNLSAWFGLGNVLADQKKFDDAEIQFRKALEIDPKEKLVYFCLGHLYQAKGDLDQTELNFKKVLDLDSNYANAWNALGDMYLECSRFPLAEAHYKKAVELSPTTPQFRYNLGLLYYNQKTYEEAEEVFQQMLEMTPENKDLFFLLGKVYIELNKFDEAESYLKKALIYMPEDKELLYKLGILYKNFKKKTEAKKIYARLMEIDPNYQKANDLIKK